MNPRMMRQKRKLIWNIYRLSLFSLIYRAGAFSLPPPAPLRRNKALSLSPTALEASSHTDWYSWKGGGKVAVRVVKKISSDSKCSPLEVSEAWMEHHWRRGGGLPILVSLPSAQSSVEPTRTVYPVAMEEIIFSSKEIGAEDNYVESPSKNDVKIQYQVSKAGPFFADLVPGSHQGTVTFSPDEMIWEVQFETTRLCALYQRVTELTIGVAARTVQEACGPTRLFTLTTNIPNQGATSAVETQSEESISLVDLKSELLDFFWARGGGLPLLPPIPAGEILKDAGLTRSKLLRVPPFITESIISTGCYGIDGGGEVADIVYRLEEPGFFTFPFLLHTHLGQIQLTQDHTEDDFIQLQWRVELRSFPFAALVVEKLVEMTIVTIVRNFLVHLAEPGATVPLTIPGMDADKCIGIRKASWFGGVVESFNRQNGHRQPPIDRIISFLTTWARGRADTACDDDNDVVSFSWTDGGKIELA